MGLKMKANLSRKDSVQSVSTMRIWRIVGTYLRTNYFLCAVISTLDKHHSKL